MHHAYDSVFKLKISLTLTSPFKMKLALALILLATASALRKLTVVTFSVLWCSWYDP